MLGKLEDRPGRPVSEIRDTEDERLDIALEEGPDTHRAWLLGREDRRIGESHYPELARGLAESDHNGVGGRVVRLLDAVMGSDDHGLIDHGDGRDGTLAPGQCQLRLREGLAHEQFVVHAWMLAEGPTTGGEALA